MSNDVRRTRTEQAERERERERERKREREREKRTRPISKLERNGRRGSEERRRRGEICVVFTRVFRIETVLRYRTDALSLAARVPLDITRLDVGAETETPEKNDVSEQTPAGILQRAFSLSLFLFLFHSGIGDHDRSGSNPQLSSCRHRGRSDVPRRVVGSDFAQFVLDIFQRETVASCVRNLRSFTIPADPLRHRFRLSFLERVCMVPCPFRISSARSSMKKPRETQRAADNSVLLSLARYSGSAGVALRARTRRRLIDEICVII